MNIDPQMLIDNEAMVEVARASRFLDSTASSHWDGKEAKGRKYDLADDPLNFSKALSNFNAKEKHSQINQRLISSLLFSRFYPIFTEFRKTSTSKITIV